MTPEPSPKTGDREAHKYLTIQMDERTMVMRGDCSCGSWHAETQPKPALFEGYDVLRRWHHHRMGTDPDQTRTERTYGF